MMRHPPAILSLLACLLAPLSLPASEETTLLAFGDSTTAPRGELKVYAGLLEKRLSRKGRAVRVINAGIGGNNTAHARARFEKDVLAHRPAIVIVQFGINDAAVDVWKTPPKTQSRVAQADYEKNLRHFVRRLREQGIRTVMMTPNPLRWTPRMLEMYGKPPYDPASEQGFNVRLELYAEILRTVARTEKVPLVDIYKVFEKFGAAPAHTVDELLLDGVHPNDRGQQLVADSLLPVLKHLLESPAAPRTKAPR